MAHVAQRVSPGSRQVRPCAGVFLFSVLVALSGGTETRAAWDVKADPPAEPVQLSVKPGQSIPLPNPTGMSPLFPTTASAFVAVGQNGAATDTREVWDLRTFQRAGSIRGKIGNSGTGPVRLSPDGRYLALTVPDTDPDRAIEVWSFADGKLAQRIEPKPRPKKIIAFDFLADGGLVVVQEAALGKVLQGYDIKTGKILWHQALPAGFHDGGFGVSPGRKYAAFMADKHLTIVEAGKGTVAGKAPFDGLPGALVFSPDGAELAGWFFSPPGMRLVVWDVTKGEIVVDHKLLCAPNFPAPGWTDGGGQRSIDWLPDGSAWMLAGHALVNRKDGRWAWSIFAPPYRDPRDKNDAFKTDIFVYTQSAKLLDNDHALVGLRGNGTPAHLEVVTLPWPQIDASLKAVESKAPALMGPGTAISLKFSVGAVRFSTPQQVQTELTEALSAVLAAQGITIADNQPVVLHVRHSEEAGPPYRIVGPGRRATGASVTSTSFTIELSLMVNGKAAPVWSDRKVATGLGDFTTSYKTGGRTDEEAMRLGGFEGLKDSLKSLGLPYFIPRPEDKNLAMLPGVTIVRPSPAAASLSANKAKTVKSTTRGQTSGAAKK